MAARFPDRKRASRALESLQHRLDGGLEAEIAPLATSGESSAGDTLLAGHFAEEQKLDVEEIVHQAGGEIVADVDERWTRPRQRAGTGRRDADTHVRGGFTY